MYRQRPRRNGGRRLWIVGSGPGKSIFRVGKNRVSHPSGNRATERLVDLIQDEGKWIDP